MTSAHDGTVSGAATSLGAATARLYLDAIEPGNGTRYELAAASVPPAGPWSGAAESPGIFVAWRGHGAALIAHDGTLATSYLREKLGGSECDASAIVLWLCSIFPNREPLVFCPCEVHRPFMEEVA